MRGAGRRGFTLIEILVVLGIIAALVTVVLTATGGTGARGKATADLQTLATIQSNVDRFVAEYGSVPTYWTATTGSGKVLTTAEVDSIMQSITGVITAANSSASFATYASNNPTMRINEDVTKYSSRMTVMATTTGAGGNGIRIVVLQYRKATSGLIVNGDNTVSSTLIPAGTAMAADFATSAAWTTAGKAAWPFTQ